MLTGLENCKYMFDVLLEEIDITVISNLRKYYNYILITLAKDR